MQYPNFQTHVPICFSSEQSIYLVIFEGENFYFRFFASAEEIGISKTTFDTGENVCGTSHTNGII